MKQILSTLNVFFRQEWITVFIISMGTVFFMYLIFKTIPLADESVMKIPPRFSLLLIAMLSVFVGIYLGSGFLRLQQSYLWEFDKVYHSNLIMSLIIAALSYGLIQLTPLLYSGWNLPVSMLAPACVTLLSAQIIIANNWFMKIIFPAIPFLLFQLTKYQINDYIILILLLAFTSFALFLNAKNRKHRNSTTAGLLSGNVERQMNSMGMQALNKIVIRLLNALKIPTKSQDFSIALLQPASRYGVGPTLITLLCPIFIYSIDNSKLVVEVFATMVLGSMVMIQCMDLSLLAKQSKPFFHLFSKEQPVLFKKKVLTMIDKHVAIHASLTIFALLLVNVILDDFADNLLLIKMGLTISIVAMSFIPVMITLAWFKINLRLFLVLGAYAVIGIIFCRWQFQHTLGDLLAPIPFISLLSLFAIRVFSTYFWKRQSIEIFMRAYG